MNELMTDMHQKSELDWQFERLQGAVLPDEVERIQSTIWEIWLNPSDPELAALMNLGSDEIEIGDFQAALMTFSEMIDLKPGYAEAWNKRATVFYHMGLYKKSLEDVEQAIALEPRHFGALSGKANILREMGQYHQACSVLRQLKKIVPYQDGLKEQIDEMRCKSKRK